MRISILRALQAEETSEDLCCFNWEVQERLAPTPELFTGALDEINLAVPLRRLLPLLNDQALIEFQDGGYCKNPRKGIFE